MTQEAPERGVWEAGASGNVCTPTWPIFNCPTSSVLVANTLYGQRFIAHKAGRIVSVHYFIGISSGNVDIGIYDCAATTRARLYGAGSTAVGTAQTWQSFFPALAVNEGDHFDVGLVFDNATASVGRDSSPTFAAVAALPTTGPILPAPQGGGLNKAAWTIATSFPAPATLSEAGLVTTGIIIPKLIVVIA